MLEPSLVNIDSLKINAIQVRTLQRKPLRHMLQGFSPLLKLLTFQDVKYLKQPKPSGN